MNETLLTFTINNAVIITLILTFATALIYEGVSRIKTRSHEKSNRCR